MRASKDVVITDATPDDVGSIADIVQRAYSRLPASQVPADMPIYHAAYHAETMVDPCTRWRLLRDPDGPAGVAMWRMLPDLAHLHLLFVAGDRQSRGYGSMLLQRFQKDAANEMPTLRLLTLHCLSCAQKAIRFYRRHGYAEYTPGDEGRLPDLYLWIDASSRDDVAWPLKKDKLLFYKLTR